MQTTGIVLLNDENPSASRAPRSRDRLGHLTEVSLLSIVLEWQLQSLRSHRALVSAMAHAVGSPSMDLRLSPTGQVWSEA
jgi:hypothetical protein